MVTTKSQYYVVDAVSDAAITFSGLTSNPRTEQLVVEEGYGLTFVQYSPPHTNPLLYAP